MAKQAAGERSVTIDGKTVTLRLDIGTIMDLEDHLGMSFFEWGLTNLIKMKVADVGMLYLAMTREKDFTNKTACREAGELLYKNGFAQTTTQVALVVKDMLDSMTKQAEKVENHPQKK